MSDREYMDQALRLAALGRGDTNPNPMVGAVVVSPSGTVVGTGYHKRAGLDHAEVLVLREAGQQSEGATLYCTLEPCCHTGRTGPCVKRIVSAGISRVVIGVEDPNPFVDGKGVRYLREHGIDVDIGVCRLEATRLNETFFTFVGKGRPFVTMKVASSLDGRIAARPGMRTRLTSKESDQRVHLLRSEVDAIGVGSGTIVADDPLLTVRGVHRTRPLWRVVFDTRLRMKPSARVLSTLEAGPVIIVTTEEGVSKAPNRARSLRVAGARLEILTARDIKAAMERLASLDITSLLLEGGAELHKAAWLGGVVDRVQMYITPTKLGAQGVPWFPGQKFSFSGLKDLRMEVIGPDVLIEGYVYRTN